MLKNARSFAVPASFSQVEPLESRIAPAVLVNGANLLGGAGNDDVGETSLGDHSVTLVKVTSGQALVWYNDGVITGISFGDGAALQVWGDSHGDIVGNLAANGRLSDSDADPLNGEDGNVLLANNLASLKISPLSPDKGSAHHIITGGSVSNVDVAGQLEGIYAGDGAFHVDSDARAGATVGVDVGIDTNPLQQGLQSSFSFAEAGAAMKAGASIKNVTIAIAKELQLIAGNGSPLGTASPTVAGAAGGGIEGVTLKSAFVDLASDPSTPSYALIAGDGGGGKTGGAGGSIVKVLDESSVGAVVLHGGNGGAGLSGKGGDGGWIRSLDMRSNSAGYDMVAGNGGSGAPGGAGGSIVTGNFTNLSPTGGIVKAGDFNGDNADDLLFVDTSTGDMVIMLNDGSAGQFSPAVQYTDLQNAPVIVIPSFGSTPSDVAVGDVDRDGDLDFVVAYKNSANVAVLFNNGDGSFWNDVDDRWVSKGVKTDGGISHVALASLGGSAALDILAVENQVGSSKLYRLISSGALTEEIGFGPDATPLAFGSEATDIVVVPGPAAKAFVSFTNGHIVQLAGGSAQTDIGLAVAGGVSGLDVSADGTQLLALGASGRSLALYDITSSTPSPLVAPTLSGAGRGLVAHFVHDSDPSTPDQITVLFTAGGGARLDTFTFTESEEEGAPGTWSVQSLASASPLKNFDVAYTGDAAGFAVLGAAANEFAFAPVNGEFEEYSLPFSGKSVFLTAGNGGLGLTFGKLVGKGGAGGAISGITVVANDIGLVAGNGGDSTNSAGGAGGSVTNGASFASTGGAVLAKLIADSSLSVAAGNGGNALAGGTKTASGGAGGSIGGLRGELTAGTIFLATGNGGNGNGGAGGAGGSVNRVEMVNNSGDLSLVTGSGGKALAGTAAGGAGGSVSTFSYELRLNETAEAIEDSYSAGLFAGDGGTSVGGVGGAGGSFSGISIIADPPHRTYDDPTVEPPLVDAELDSTFHFALRAGNGGHGASGGAAGSARDLSVQIVHDQHVEKLGIVLNYAVAEVFTGQGGNGFAGNGGAGGDVVNARFIGITDMDPDSADDYMPALLVVAQDGGTGPVKGGNGGNLFGISASNAPFGGVAGSTVVATNMLSGAVLVGGNGGNGGSGDAGKGGDLSALKVSVQGYGLYAFAGNGANSTAAKGGAGGAVKDSILALVSTVNDDGMVVIGGSGGHGATAGGAGGALLKLKLNGPVGRVDGFDQTTLGRPITLTAGDGGNATGSGGKAGAGGDINGITQTKDVFSTISSIIAGNGGNAASGVGGKGGSVQAVKTLGFLGKPSTDSGRLGVFDEDGEVQGIFVGRGGTGTVAGANGSVTGVSARQIAAISARADENGFFAPALKVSGVTADVIGYDLDADGLFDGATASPATGVPIDGFLFASSISGVTGSRPAFTFTA